MDKQGSKSINHVWAHSVGDIIDPMDLKYYFTDVSPLSNYMNFTIDSMFYRYIYIRNVDSIRDKGIMRKMVDTAILQIYVQDALTFGLVNFPNGDKISYSTPANQDHTTGLGKKVLKTIKIPLDEKDSTIMGETGWHNKIKFISIDANMNASSSRLGAVFGYSLTFPSVLGDTMFNRYDNSSFKTAHGGIVNQHNYFGIIRYNNNGNKILRETTYNNSFTSTKDVRYGQTTADGWKNYIPEVSSWGFIGFKLTHFGSIKKINKKRSELSKAYPNPVTYGEVLNIDFKLETTSNVTITVMDIHGKVLKTDSFLGIQGMNTVPLSIENLPIGLYLYSITAPNFTVTERISINL